MKRSAAVLAAFVAFVPPLLARAQSPASGANDGADIPKDPEARKVLAKARFDEGAKFYEQKAYDVALTEFKRSYAIYKSRPAGQNAAFVLRAVGRFDEALDMVEDVIKNVPNIKAEDAARLEELRVDLFKLVGFLVVRASEPSSSP